MRILIAEDETASQVLIKTILSPYGECECVDNGEKAVAAYENSLKTQNPYDLVILDIMMPVMDGQEALKQIRTLEKETGIAKSGQIKIVMLTALGDQGNVIKAFFKGQASEYIVKPIEKEKIIAKLKLLKLIE